MIGARVWKNKKSLGRELQFASPLNLSGIAILKDYFDLGKSLTKSRPLNEV